VNRASDSLTAWLRFGAGVTRTTSQLTATVTGLPSGAAVPAVLVAQSPPIGDLTPDCTFSFLASTIKQQYYLDMGETAEGGVTVSGDGEAELSAFF
jgi:hypothetical protein